MLQRPLPQAHPADQVADDGAGALPAQSRHEQVFQALARDQSLAFEHVRAHPVDPQHRLGQRAVERLHRQVGAAHQAAPFGEFRRVLPQAALVFGRHAAHQAGDALRRALDRRQRLQRGHRILLVRHRQAGAVALAGRLVELVDLGLRHQREVLRQLAEVAAQQAHLHAQAQPAVALRVPAHVGQRQRQLGGHGRQHVLGAVAHRVQRADGAAQLQQQRGLALLAQPLGAAQQRHQPVHQLEAQADHLRRLHHRAAQHRHGGMPLGQFEQSGAELLQVVVDQAQRLAGAQHHRGIDQILGGGAAMHVDRGGRVEQRDRLAQPLHHRQGQVAAAWRRRHERRHVIELGAAQAGDRLRRRRRDHAHAGRGPRERGLHIHHRLDHRGRREHRFHRGGRQKSLEQHLRPLGRGCYRGSCVRRTQANPLGVCLGR